MVLCCFNGSFETYTRYSGVDNIELKKVMGVFVGCFLGGHSFSNFQNGGHCSGNPVYEIMSKLFNLFYCPFFQLKLSVYSL